MQEPQNKCSVCGFNPCHEGCGVMDYEQNENQICTAVFDGIEMCGQPLAYYRGVAYCPACQFPDGPHYRDFPNDITPWQWFCQQVDAQITPEPQRVLQPCNCNCGDGVFHPSTITCPNCDGTMEQIETGLFRCSECYYGIEGIQIPSMREEH